MIAVEPYISLPPTRLLKRTYQPKIKGYTYIFIIKRQNR